jgi:1,4-alpha-glucan branching enzyme
MVDEQFDYFIDGWHYESHKLEKKDYGVWEIFLPDNADGSEAIPHGSKVKVRCRFALHCYFNFVPNCLPQIALRTPAGETVTRIPAWIRYATQEPNNPVYDGARQWLFFSFLHC